ncbi:unnamed protein product [Triticum turgidum subsp. durum]|uniref:P-type Ca(2+) transporter n=1 Tax=Triticum turgidum subsp. durum TaxID=4567 RepID=A0A9R0VDA9_TRITD|nr:unnamed protein product [Triticum turgidum subsp. durum]
MECADILIAVGRRSTSPSPSSSWQPGRQWRKALTVIRTCHRLARLGILSAGVLPRSTAFYVAIKIHHDGSDSDAADTAAFSVAADDELFKGLVKEKREDCFRRLGGGAGIAAALASDAERGIRGDADDVRRRRESFGGNTYPKPKPKSFFSHVWDALKDVFLIVLLVCAVVSLGFGIKEHGLKDGWYDGVSIFLAVFLVAAVSAVSNHSQAKRFDKLASESDNIAVTVVRAGRRQEVSIFDILVGDVVILKIGDSVPADGVFLEGHGLQVDESSMTGEPHPIEIDAEKSPFLTGGVKIVDGYGRMLVTAVGTDTLWGEMMSSITKETAEPTPLQERLERLTSSIGKIGVAVAVLVFTVLTARHFTGSTKDDQGKPLFNKGHVTFDAVFSSLVVIFQQAVTIIVVAIPEGLPLAVTLTLAFSMKRMVKENALVRRLSACETMGSVTAICTDKTGTLTLNQMKVTEFWVGTDQPRGATAIAGSVVTLLCQGAGLNTTGSVYKPDNILTARAIAKECGIISSKDPSGIVIEGHEFRAMSPEQQLEIVDRIRVMARSLPLDKLALVQRLKQKGHVVAVTGDGTNDAPALKEADVGLSMGVQGTEVAKESSDIIILNDNFDTVVTATRWGRCVYNNIQKFIQFQLTVNVAALVINFVSAITTGKMPLTTVQLLWVNLIMDTMGALALATDTPTKALMDRPPIGRTAPLISNAMWRNLAAQAAFQIAVLLALQYRGRDVFGTDEKGNGTMIFNAFVLCQVFNEFNAREIEKKNVFAGVLKNRMFLVIIAVTLALQVVMVEVLTRFAGTKRLGLGQWGVCLAIAAVSWPIGWAVKFIPVPDRTLHDILTRRKSS